MRADSRKFLSVGVLLLIATLTVNGASPRETDVVKDVSFKNNGDSLEVRIAAPDGSKFTHFELNQPHRLVVDFHGIQNTIGFKEKQINSAGVERVRTSFFSAENRRATRIVFDLKDNVPYRVIGWRGNRAHRVWPHGSGSREPDSRPGHDSGAGHVFDSKFPKAAHRFRAAAR